jgi:hypothetical protein
MQQFVKPEALARETEPPAKGAPKLSLVEKRSPAARAQQLLAEARAVASEQVAALDLAVTAVRELATEIADGGELYPAGLRDICRRLSEELLWKAKTIAHLAQETPDRGRPSAGERSS